MNSILIFFLLFTSLYAKSSDFSIIINKPFNDALFDITQDYDRDISAVGFSKNYETSSASSGTSYTDPFEYLKNVSSKNGSQISLVKVNNAADIVLNKTTNLSRVNKAVSILKTPSNGYLIGGYTLDGSLIILKLDSNGNTLFTKIFGTATQDKMSKLLQLSDGGVLAVGSSTTSRSAHDTLFETGLGLNDIYLTRFSKDGTKLWSKKYGTQYDDQGVDAAEADDGSIIVLSITKYEIYKNITLMRTSESGDKIWLQHYKSETLVTPYRIIKLKDNNFLMSLSQENELHKDQIRLVKFDLQNNIIIDRNIDTSYSSGLKDIKEFSDGTLMGVGYVNDTYNTDALVMVLNNELSLLNQEHYGEENFDMFNALTILHNSQVAAAGIHTDNNSQESNMWIVKLNRDATMAQISKTMLQTSNKMLPTSEKARDFYNELLKLFQDEINAKKLVIKEDLTIEIIDSSLYFKVGKYILTPAQQMFLTSFSNKLIPFLHANKDIVNTLELNGHTSSEWGGAKFTMRYLKNAKLSMNRAYSTLSYMFQIQNQDAQNWLVEILKGSGFSYSKKIMINKTEDQELSRRVAFKIILNAK